MDQETSVVLRVNSFKGLQNLPLCVAMRQGHFTANGLTVELTYTTGSAAQLAGLARGDYHLAQTAPDNVINYETNPAGFGVDPTTASHIAMVLGGSIGPLGVYARREVRDLEGLRGAAIGVDNPTSGFALVLRDLLRRRGLVLGRDYRFVVAGGTHARCDALLAGTIAATVLYAPFDLRAAQEGCALLASSDGTYAAYASASTAGVRSWLEAHGESVTHYIAAVLRALRWLYDPANAEATQALMRSEAALGVAPDMVQAAYSSFVSPETGFGRDAALDEGGLRQVIALRREYGLPSVHLGAPTEYCDVRWYEAVRARLSAEE